jgi:hypothetical protein
MSRHNRDRRHRFDRGRDRRPPEPADTLSVEEMRQVMEEVDRGVYEGYRRAREFYGTEDVVAVVWPNPADDRLHATVAPRVEVLLSDDDFSRRISPKIRQPPPEGYFYMVSVMDVSSGPTTWSSLCNFKTSLVRKP